MARAVVLSAYALAAACWLVGGPGGVVRDALLACRHHQTHQSHGGHPGAPTDGPCFCDEMTGGSDLAVSLAVPAPLALPPVVAAAVRSTPRASPFLLPPSPSFAPESPPPNGLA